jgi:excisionase family DNA binding protein
MRSTSAGASLSAYGSCPSLGVWLSRAQSVEVGMSRFVGTHAFALPISGVLIGPMTSPVAQGTPDQLLTVKELAAHLNVSLASAYDIVEGRSGGAHLQVVRIGRRVRIRREDLDRFISRHHNDRRDHP